MGPTAKFYQYPALLSEAALSNWLPYGVNSGYAGVLMAAGFGWVRNIPGGLTNFDHPLYWVAGTLGEIQFNLETIDDPGDWTRITADALYAGQFNDIASAPLPVAGGITGRFVFAGAAGEIQSVDGDDLSISGATRQNTGGGDFYAVVRGTNNFIAVGVDRIATSPDGLSPYTSRALPAPANLWEVSVGIGPTGQPRIIACGDLIATGAATIIYSDDDGLTWSVATVDPAYLAFLSPLFGLQNYRGNWYAGEVPAGGAVPFAQISTDGGNTFVRMPASAFAKIAPAAFPIFNQFTVARNLLLANGGAGFSYLGADGVFVEPFRNRGRSVSMSYKAIVVGSKSCLAAGAYNQFPNDPAIAKCLFLEEV